MKKIALIALLALAGCASTAPQVQYVPVPAAKPEMPQKPALVLDTLTEQSSLADIMKAYAASLNQCIGYSQQLETILKAQ